jgi:hypothetical protein
MDDYVEFDDADFGSTDPKKDSCFAKSKVENLHEEYERLLLTVATLRIDRSTMVRECAALRNRIDRITRERPLEKIAAAWVMLPRDDRVAMVSILTAALNIEAEATDSFDDLGSAIRAMRQAQEDESYKSNNDIHDDDFGWHTHSSRQHLEDVVAMREAAQKVVKEKLAALLQIRNAKILEIENEQDRTGDEASSILSGN